MVTKIKGPVDRKVRITGDEHIFGQRDTTKELEEQYESKVGLVMVRRLNGSVFQSLRPEESPSMLFVMSWPSAVIEEAEEREIDIEHEEIDFELDSYVKLSALSESLREQVRQEVKSGAKKLLVEG